MNRTATPITNAARILLQDGYDIDVIVPFLKSLNQPTEEYVYMDEIINIEKYQLEQSISSRFNNSTVTDVSVDEEFGNVTATVDEVSNVDCGFIEEYDRLSVIVAQ